MLKLCDGLYINAFMQNNKKQKHTSILYNFCMKMHYERIESVVCVVLCAAIAVCYASLLCLLACLVKLRERRVS